jgi:hypothetical protein
VKYVNSILKTVPGHRLAKCTDSSRVYIRDRERIAQAMRQQREADEPRASAELEDPTDVPEQIAYDRQKILAKAAATTVQSGKPADFDIAVSFNPVVHGVRHLTS